MQGLLCAKQLCGAVGVGELALSGLGGKTSWKRQRLGTIGLEGVAGAGTGLWQCTKNADLMGDCPGRLKHTYMRGGIVREKSEAGSCRALSARRRGVCLIC